MMKQIYTLAMLANLVVLTGCASTYSHDLMKSGTSIYIGDYPVEKPATQDVQELGGLSLFRVLQIASAGYAGSLGGASAAGKSLLMDEAVASSRLEPGEYNMVFSWLPKGYGDSPEAVEERFAQETRDVVRTALENYGLQMDLEQAKAINQYGRTVVPVSGGDCGPKTEPKCLFEFTLKGKYIDKPFLAQAPDLVPNVGGKEVWSLTTHSYAPQSHRVIALMTPPDAAVDAAAIYADISQNLPGIAFVYLAKSPSYHVAVGAPGKIKGYYYLLHDGKELSFQRK